MKKISIINKFGPGSNAVTGQNAKELADFLHGRQIDIQFICLRAEYSAVKKPSLETPGYRLTELRNLYSGKSPLLRILTGLLDGFRLWLASLRFPSDAVIVMTDPPLLFFWFQLFRVFSKRKLFYWTMDLYPEAFVAGNYIGPGNIFYKFFHSIVYRKIPDMAIVLGNRQLQFLEEKFRRPFPHVIIPCGIVDFKKAPDHGKPVHGKIRFGYGGNIGEAHDAEFLIALIRQLDPEKHEMIVSLYGAKAAYVTQAVKNGYPVQFMHSLSLDDIASIDINVATLLPRWHHICVPSKAVTAICCCTSLLINSTKEADSWEMFKEVSWIVEPGKAYDLAIRETIQGIKKEHITDKKLKAGQLSNALLTKKAKAFQLVADKILDAGAEIHTGRQVVN